MLYFFLIYIIVPNEHTVFKEVYTNMAIVLLQY